MEHLLLLLLLLFGFSIFFPCGLWGKHSAVTSCFHHNFKDSTKTDKKYFRSVLSKMDVQDFRLEISPIHLHCEVKDALKNIQINYSSLVLSHTANSWTSLGFFPQITKNINLHRANKRVARSASQLHQCDHRHRPDGTERIWCMLRSSEWGLQRLGKSMM